MKFEGVEKALFSGSRLKQPVSKGAGIKASPGYYSIWIREIENLPSPFSDELNRRKTNLLYIGVAEGSLLLRLWEQELQHLRAATFFRSIGAVLNYRPERGSLIGMGNQNNYRFSKANTQRIIEWIDNSLEVASVQSPVDKTIENKLIAKHTPLLNWTHNPNKYLPLKAVKAECRLIARNP